MTTNSACLKLCKQFEYSGEGEGTAFHLPDPSPDLTLLNLPNVRTIPFHGGSRLNSNQARCSTSILRKEAPDPMNFNGSSPLKGLGPAGKRREHAEKSKARERDCNIH